MLKFDRNGTPSTVVSCAKFHCALFFLFVHFNWIQDLDLLLKILLQNRHKICFHAIPLCTFWLHKEATSINSIYNLFTTLIRGNRHKSLLGGKVWVTMDLSEFNANVRTRNNGEHQCSPYDPGIQKWPFFLFMTQEKKITHDI